MARSLSNPTESGGDCNSARSTLPFGWSEHVSKKRPNQIYYFHGPTRTCFWKTDKNVLAEMRKVTEKYLAERNVFPRPEVGDVDERFPKKEGEKISRPAWHQITTQMPDDRTHLKMEGNASKDPNDSFTPQAADTKGLSSTIEEDDDEEWFLRQAGCESPLPEVLEDCTDPNCLYCQMNVDGLDTGQDRCIPLKTEHNPRATNTVLNDTCQSFSSGEGAGTPMKIEGSALATSTPIHDTRQNLPSDVVANSPVIYQGSTSSPVTDAQENLSSGRKLTPRGHPLITAPDVPLCKPEVKEKLTRKQAELVARIERKKSLRARYRAKRKVKRALALANKTDNNLDGPPELLTIASPHGTNTEDLTPSLQATTRQSSPATTSRKRKNKSSPQNVTGAQASLSRKKLKKGLPQASGQSRKRLRTGSPQTVIGGQAGLSRKKAKNLNSGEASPSRKTRKKNLSETCTGGQTGLSSKKKNAAASKQLDPFRGQKKNSSNTATSRHRKRPRWRKRKRNSADYFELGESPRKRWKYLTPPHQEKMLLTTADDSTRMERTLNDSEYGTRRENGLIDPELQLGSVDAMEIDPSNNEWYIIMDTNIFLVHLKYVKELLAFYMPEILCPVLVIPWAVLSELDVIKKGMNEMGMRARRAVSFFEKTIGIHPRLRGQSWKSARKLDTASGDEGILACALEIFTNSGSRAVLLSNDRNLCNRALVNNLNGYSVRAMMEKFKGLGAFFSAGIATETMLTAPPVKGGHSADNFLSKLKYYLNFLLKYVLSTYMRERYGDDWLSEAAVEPPWALNDIFLCIERHWGVAFTKYYHKSINMQLRRLKNKISRYGYFMKDILELIEEVQQLCYRLIRPPVEDFIVKSKPMLDNLQDQCTEVLHHMYGKDPSGSDYPSCITGSSFEEEENTADETDMVDWSGADEDAEYQTEIFDSAGDDESDVYQTEIIDSPSADENTAYQTEMADSPGPDENTVYQTEMIDSPIADENTAYQTEMIDSSIADENTVYQTEMIDSPIADENTVYQTEMIDSPIADENTVYQTEMIDSAFADENSEHQTPDSASVDEITGYRTEMPDSLSADECSAYQTEMPDSASPDENTTDRMDIPDSTSADGNAADRTETPDSTSGDEHSDFVDMEALYSQKVDDVLKKTIAAVDTYCGCFLDALKVNHELVYKRPDLVPSIDELKRKLPRFYMFMEDLIRSIEGAVTAKSMFLSWDDPPVENLHKTLNNCSSVLCVEPPGKIDLFDLYFYLTQDNFREKLSAVKQHVERMRELLRKEFAVEPRLSSSLPYS